MKLLSELLSALPVDPIPVQNVIIGVHWTLVSSKHAGLGSTLTNPGPHGGEAVRDVGFLHQKSAQELAGWILSDNLLEASIGMAAVNSLLDVNENSLVEINAAEVIAQKSQDKNLAIVGHFPFVERMKTVARNCWVIEKQPYGDDYPKEMAGQLIPQADVIAITGTTLINHTIKTLLPLCRSDALVMLLGPSTPLSSILFNYGISILSGSIVVDQNLAIQTIQQGATFQQVKGVRRVTMSRGM